MDLKWLIILIVVSFLTKVSLQRKVLYKPTEFPYSRCFKNGTNRISCEKLNISKERQEKLSMWPPGPYAIPMSAYGCPESQSRGWLKSYLIGNITVNQDSNRLHRFFGDYYVSSYHWKTSMMTLFLCVKFRNEAMLDKGQWIPGNYSIYKIGLSCPSDFQESSIQLPTFEFVSYGVVPNITVSEEGQSEEFLTLSLCKRTTFTETGYSYAKVSFKMLETDFILEKDPDTNCSQFDMSTVSQKLTSCFYNPKVTNIDYESATESTKVWFIDLQRSLEVLMIEVKTPRS
ncbi:uncharacterized protein LOC132744930, partial [Ruditapes philippinarum]|uniref:uncharacterized protein LOC132744930 n=1 Tax=Ruditapes philippinarum TaxID=129788 RepID=UPI00295BF360